MDPRLARAHRLKIARLYGSHSLGALASAARGSIEYVAAVEAGGRPAWPDYVRAVIAWGFRPVVLVTGGRDYADRRVVGETLLALRPTRVIHGAAQGADRLAREWAESWGTVLGMNGPIRNGAMLEAEDAALDLVVAFPGGRGTADMVRRARNVGVPVLMVGKG